MPEVCSYLNICYLSLQYLNLSPIPESCVCVCVRVCVYVCVQITSAYITSRLEAMESVVRDNLENPLDDNTIVSQQLDQMATIGRFDPFFPSHFVIVSFI